MKFRKLIIGLGLWLAAGAVHAQQSAQYTQYIFNGLIINPAYAGSKEIWNANLIYRSQWAGLEGAPTTQTFSIDGALRQNKIGFGFQVMNDRLGAQGQLGAMVNAAVNLNVSERGRLSFGLGGGISQYTLDGTKLRLTNPDDPAIPLGKFSTATPDAKAGAYFHTDRFYLGVSAANLISVKNEYVLTPDRHYFLTSGYVFDLSEGLKFKPSFLLKEDFKSPANLDLNAFLLFGDRLWLGASYRTGLDMLKDIKTDDALRMNNAVAGIVEFYISPKFKVGYSYDMTLTQLDKYASHEFSVGYFFLNKEDSRMLTPRYF